MESLFIAWRLTGDPQYRAWGWGIFEAIEKHCRIESGGYASVLNVDALPVKLEDKMETFLMVRVPRPPHAAPPHHTRLLTDLFVAWTERDAEVPVSAILGRHRPPTIKYVLSRSLQCGVR